VAIWNDFWHIHEYGRMNRQGHIERVANVNLIFAGETLYHLPTYEAARKSVAPALPAPAKPVAPAPLQSDAAKKRIALEALKGEYRLQGEHLEFLSKAIDYIGYADNALTIAEIAGLIAEGGLVATAAPFVTVAAGILTPVGLTISIVNALESGLRMYGMRAIPYTMTAWAFDNPIPASSQVIFNRNIRFYGAREAPRYQQAWQNASQATRRNLEEEVGRRKVAKRSYQTLLCVLGDGVPKQLCRVLMTGLEKEFEGNQAAMWKSTYGVEYPN
jgi:hypothetical protein